MAMTIEQLKRWARTQAIFDDVTEREREEAIAAIDALTQPAQACPYIVGNDEGSHYCRLAESKPAQAVDVVGYCTHDEFAKLLKRKGEPGHNFAAIEVWNKPFLSCIPLTRALAGEKAEGWSYCGLRVVENADIPDGELRVYSRNTLPTPPIDWEG